MKKRFGIDIDGTVTRPDTFVPFLNDAFQLNLTYEDITQYDFYPYVNVSKEDFNHWFLTNEPIFYKESLPADGAKEVLNAWTASADLYYISARTPHLLDVTEKWFAKHRLSYDHLELIGSHNKVATAKKLAVDLFLEDKHDNAVAIAEECNIPVLLFNTPYNQDPVPNSVIRIQSWHEAQTWVRKWLQEQQV
ncbi:hypothetical protein ACIQ4Z_02150 [Peribacillus asahii]|uniref:5' nucleotidase, NT5C type n=1 Tax=Peribacillus asahii TaxID=228899 RepID=UPI0037F1E94A